MRLQNLSGATFFKVESHPCLRSPSNATVIVADADVEPMQPSSVLIVYTSKRACVGCSPTPSPALMMGLRDTADAIEELPFEECLKTITSAKQESVRMVSSRLSPFFTLECSLFTTKTVPPRRNMADWKEQLVRVLGSRNAAARTLCCSRLSPP